MPFLLLIFCLWFPSAYKRWTHAFRPAKCTLVWPHMKEWETAPLQDFEIAQVLQEPFSYLTKGAQSYVFLSRDQRYVLKLFRFDTCRIPFGQKTVRFLRKWAKMRQKHEMPLAVKIPKTFGSCKMAFEKASDLTGVVFIHLNPKEALPKICVQDRLKRTHLLDPARIRFALQRRAEPLLKTLLQSDQRQREKLLDSFLCLLAQFQDRGFVNLDPTFGRNFGVLDGKAIILDFGNFAFDPIRSKGEWISYEKRLYKWLKKRIPKSAFYLEEKR